MWIPDPRGPSGSGGAAVWKEFPARELSRLRRLANLLCRKDRYFAGPRVLILYYLITVPQIQLSKFQLVGKYSY